MDLSIVIVNYNVKYFLEQCLHSVKKAMEGLETEVFVVDNNSVDGSCSHIRERFPWVKLIENRENVGFSKANNQAIRAASGKYVLLLNPDTVVEEDTFRKCFRFMETHDDAGALGVKMIDGSGHFLPESKRAFPTPWVAFYKIFGLSRLFPRSKKFGKYHLGYLPGDASSKIEVLAGAFMFLRRETLDKVGLLDEDYFMYGEDIDLSYRIIMGGYNNYYFPEAIIIHYKGESTKKGSLNYVLVFYNAMIIFARKHFSTRNARYYTLVINLAIYLRASMAVTRRFVKKIYRQVVDAGIIYAGFLAGLPIWESYKFNAENYYPEAFMHYVVPGYILVWILSAYYSGGYDKPLKLWKYFRGILVGTFTILVVYALLPESLRFSRALILLGTLWTLIATGGLRWLLHLFGTADYQLDLNRKKRIVIVGEKQEADRVTRVLEKTQVKPEIIGYVSPEPDYQEPYLGSVDQIEEITRIHKLDEILFCAANISSRRIIKIMTRLTGLAVNYKIAPPESLSIIGSNSINTSGELYTIHFNSIGKAANLRSKRLFDIIASLVLILFFPFWAFFVHHPLRAVSRLFRSLVGKRTIVGYYNGTTADTLTLPKLRKGILHPAVALKDKDADQETLEKLNVIYAKDYKPATDLQILLKGFRQLGARDH
ncbi:MAG: glycosyltransferase [Bacteroidales bacterium]|nr:glycosyltransferase [Bacteroidales bacterium]MDT8431539.1 glycosyltransferase [Bacteroidales bacterium]